MLSRLVALSCLVAACSTSPSTRVAPEQEAHSVSSKAQVTALRARENAVRASFLPGTAPPWIDVSGSDPYRVVPDGANGYVGILRGSKALVRLDHELTLKERVALPESPTALCVSGYGEAWVGSRYDQRLLRVRGPDVEARASVAAGIADVACGLNGLVYALAADGSELLTLDASGLVRDRRPALAGGLRLLRRGRYLLESSLFERSLRVLWLDDRGLPTRELGRLKHDGTLWTFDALEQARGLLVAVAGVEDRALVRAHGEFENIDSFVWSYRLEGGVFDRLTALDLSDAGVVVPKALSLADTSEGPQLSVLAAGSGRLLRMSLEGAPRLVTTPALPGVADAVFETKGDVIYASPLFDAFVKLDRDGVHVARMDPERRPEPALRLGEALFFTELMAPENLSSGSHSRFTCETCHFEGGVDGRVHYTGRADISVVTKPLFGLANNRPHFSRAMDPDLSSVSHNEFRVAGAGSGTDPWFRLETARFPWLNELGIDRAELKPLELREALLRFLYAFSHAPNPRSQGRERFSALEAEGAHAFRDLCQSCHDARLLSDDARSRVAFSDWESQIFSRNAPIVWARGDYEKTGIFPYVHERGTRVTSLRRLSLKPRYFTNGSAPSLGAVLERFRTSGGTPWHDAPSGDELAPPTRAALLAFLRLL
jgi:hypothetical protein